MGQDKKYTVKNCGGWVFVHEQGKYSGSSFHVKDVGRIMVRDNSARHGGILEVLSPDGDTLCGFSVDSHENALRLHEDITNAVNGVKSMDELLQNAYERDRFIEMIKLVSNCPCCSGPTAVLCKGEGEQGKACVFHRDPGYMPIQLMDQIIGRVVGK